MSGVVYTKRLIGAELAADAQAHASVPAGKVWIVLALDGASWVSATVSGKLGVELAGYQAWLAAYTATTQFTFQWRTTQAMVAGETITLINTGNAVIDVIVTGWELQAVL